MSGRFRYHDEKLSLPKAEDPQWLLSSIPLTPASDGIDNE